VNDLRRIFESDKAAASWRSGRRTDGSGGRGR
jgi:hypothetical protein